MNEIWKSFLESRSASVGDDGSVHFPDAPPAADCSLCDLSHLGLIRAAGEDAASFLQGQLTNDVRELTAAHSQLSAFCSPKGRMLASLRLFRRGGDIYLQLPAINLEPVLKRLRMYVLRSRVTLEDASNELVTLGIAGPCALDLLQRRFTDLPDSPGGVTEADELCTIRLPAQGGTPRFQVIGPVEAMQDLWRELSATATAVDADYWSLMDIRAGVPTLLPENIEAFVPQMLNLQLVDGVSFTKGCYTGQEIVARMQYLGKLKRRMYLAHVDTERAPLPGDELFCASSESGQGTGRVVEARAAPEGGFDLLVVVERASAESEEVRVGQGGPKLVFLDLPYPLPED